MQFSYLLVADNGIGYFFFIHEMKCTGILSILISHLNIFWRREAHRSNQQDADSSQSGKKFTTVKIIMQTKTNKNSWLHSLLNLTSCPRKETLRIEKKAVHIDAYSIQSYQ